MTVPSFFPVGKLSKVIVLVTYLVLVYSRYIVTRIPYDKMSLMRVLLRMCADRFVVHHAYPPPRGHVRQVVACLWKRYVCTYMDTHIHRERGQAGNTLTLKDSHTHTQHVAKACA